MKSPLEDIMYRLKMTTAAVALAAMIPVSSFAWIDFGIYGGYSLSGYIESSSGRLETSGPEYGCMGHLTYSLPLLATVGVGGFYQYSDLSYKVDSERYDFQRSVLGVDAFMQIDLPQLPLKPYGRVAAGAVDKVKAEHYDSTDYLQNYSAGAGLAWVQSIEAIKLNIFAEYIYVISIFKGDKRGSSHAVHIGTKVGI